MGRGRDNRHKKRRREQSNKAKKKQKVTKSAQKRHKSKRKKNKEKNKMALSSDSVRYIKLGMSGKFLIDPKYSEYMDTLREWHEDGTLTDITFLAFGKWNSRTRKRLWGILKENGNKWAWNHLVFKLPHEFETAFILRNIRCFKMSHYVDTEKTHIEPIVMSQHYRHMKLFRWHDEAERGWTEMKAWLKRHNPIYFELYEPGNQSDVIIQTGIRAEPEPQEPQETHVSNRYDYEDIEWLGF